MKKRNLIALLPAAAMMTLAGCGGDSAVTSTLKKMPFPVGTSLTYEQALDRRAVCANTSWEVSEDSRGREVVQYECDLKGVDAFNDNFAAGSNKPREELELMSGATHVIEWFHADDQYEMHDTRVVLYTDGKAEETVNISKRVSFQVAIDDDITELSELLSALNNLKSPFGW